MRDLIYLIYFSNHTEPFKIKAKTFLELLDEIRYVTERAQQPPEFIIRVYR